MILYTIEVEGTLQSDGRLVLDEKPNLPAGRVRVALQSLAAPQLRTERLPDLPESDDCISAPVDLPYFGVVDRVKPRLVEARLPEFTRHCSENAE